MYFMYPNIKANTSGKTAYANIRGGSIYPQINGAVYFQEVPNGVNVSVTVSGLPQYTPAQEGRQQIGPFGFHIHEVGDCNHDMTGQFEHTGGHWNPTNQPHGNHAGDFPVLFSNNGAAAMSFFTNKFKVGDIIGKSIVIHESPDDYRTQPAGNSGRKIACGVVMSFGV